MPSNWTVKLFPEEEEFISEVFRRKQNNEDGRGDFIAPVRGGIIYLNDYSDHTEEQTKWLVFCRLQDARYKIGGVRGLRFMNFTYNNELPAVMTDPEAEDKWGVKRTTTDGQPVNDTTGYPLEYVEHEILVKNVHEWAEGQNVFVKSQEQVLHQSFRHDGWPIPEKVLE